MQKFKTFLAFGLFVSVFLGELTRIPITDGIAVSLLDIFTTLIMLIVIKEQILTKKITNDDLFKPLLIFILIGALSLLLNMYWLKLKSTEIFISFLYTVRFALLAGVYFFIKSLAYEFKKKIPYFMIFVSSLIVLVGFVQYFYIDFTTLSFLDWDIHWYRLFSTFIDPNFMGVFLTISLFINLMLLIKSKFTENKKKFVFLCVSAILLLTGILLTFSRTALVSLIFGLVIFGFNFKQGKKIVAAIAICLIIGVGIILLNYQATEGTKLFRLSSSEARITSIKWALSVIKDHPIIGIGFNAYRYAMHRYGFAIAGNWQYSHSDASTDNSFLYVLATTGIIGFVSYLYLIFKLIIKLLKPNTKNNALSIVGISSLGAVSLSSLFINALFYPLILVWMWIIIGLTET